MMSGITTLLLGATGETGKEVAKQLLTNGQVKKVILVGRRKVKEEDLGGEIRDGVVSD